MALGLVVVFTLVGAGVAVAQEKQPQEPARGAAKNARLLDLQSLDDLREAFNRDAGKIRLILLLSPT